MNPRSAEQLPGFSHSRDLLFDQEPRVLYSSNSRKFPCVIRRNALTSSVKSSWRRHENAPGLPRFSSHCLDQQLRCSFSPNPLATAVNAIASATFSEVSSSDELELNYRPNFRHLCIQCFRRHNIQKSGSFLFFTLST